MIRPSFMNPNKKTTANNGRPSFMNPNYTEPNKALDKAKSELDKAKLEVKQKQKDATITGAIEKYGNATIGLVENAILSLSKSSPLTKNRDVMGLSAPTGLVPQDMVKKQEQNIVKKQQQVKKATDYKNVLGLDKKSGSAIDILSMVNKPQQVLFGGVNAGLQKKDIYQGMEKAAVNPVQNESGGRILRTLGVKDSGKKIGVDDILGTVIDFVLDPTNLIGAGALKKGISTAKNANKAQELFNAATKIKTQLNDSKKVQDLLDLVKKVDNPTLTNKVDNMLKQSNLIPTKVDTPKIDNVIDNVNDIVIDNVKVVPKVENIKFTKDIDSNVRELDKLPAKDKLLVALKNAEKSTKKQEVLNSIGRKEQFAKMMSIKDTGRAGFYKTIGSLKGEFEKVSFDSLEKSLKESDIDELFDTIKKSSIPEWKKLPAGTGLDKLLKGQLPTNNEQMLLSKVFGNELITELASKREFMKVVSDGFKDVINVPRSLFSSFDLSAPGRQGIALIGKPKQYFGAFKPMLKGAFSEKEYTNIIKNIENRDTFGIMKRAGLALTDPTGNMLQKEEAFLSNIAEKIPVVGKGVRASDRAYSAFLNKLRADTFDDLYKKISKSAPEFIDNEKGLQDLANFVNNATGRGKLPEALQSSAQLLNGVFFSPRLMASRVNLLNPIYYAKLDPLVRKEAIKTIAKSGAILGSVLGALSTAGAVVELDPRSSDFLKARFGKTRYDIAGGFSQYIRLGAQMLLGETKNSATGNITKLGGAGYKPTTRLDLLYRFMENKESPVAGLITRLLKGSDFEGKKLTLGSEIDRLTVPGTIQEMEELYKEHGPLGVLMAIPAIFGIGSQTYGDNTKKSYEELVKIYQDRKAKGIDTTDIETQLKNFK